MPIFNDYANGKPLKEIDYFIDKIYVDDDGNLSFVIKRYGKDGTKLVEMSADELIENQGFTRFDNFTLCSTQNPREKSPGFFFAVFRPLPAASLKIDRFSLSKGRCDESAQGL